MGGWFWLGAWGFVECLDVYIVLLSVSSLVLGSIWRALTCCNMWQVVKEMLKHIRGKIQEH